MTLLILFFVLESISWFDLVAAVAGVILLIVLLKSGLLKELTKASGELLDKRTIERDDARSDLERCKSETEELEKELRAMRRDSMQRAEINWQDQETIRALKMRIIELEVKK